MSDFVEFGLLFLAIGAPILLILPAMGAERVKKYKILYVPVVIVKKIVKGMLILLSLLAFGSYDHIKKIEKEVSEDSKKEVE